MKITYDNEASFYTGINLFVTTGLMFNADHFNLTINLTGGH